jgi:hypothetical protein
MRTPRMSQQCPRVRIPVSSVADARQQLDFDEFYAMLPRRVRDHHRSREIRKWFTDADTDGSGELSVHEFFRWTLSQEALKHGAGSIESICQRYDKHQSGVLNLFQFERLCTDMNFSGDALDIFRVLDTKKTGFLSYAEIQEAVQSHDIHFGVKAERLLTTVAWSWHEGVVQDKKEMLEREMEGARPPVPCNSSPYLANSFASKRRIRASAIMRLSCGARVSTWCGQAG